MRTRTVALFTILLAATRVVAADPPRDGASTIYPGALPLRVPGAVDFSQHTTGGFADELQFRVVRGAVLLVDDRGGESPGQLFIVPLPQTCGEEGFGDDVQLVETFRDAF